MNVKLERAEWEVLLRWETADAVCLAYLRANSPLPMLAEMEAQARAVAALGLPVSLPIQTLRMRRLKAGEMARVNQGPIFSKQPKSKEDDNDETGY